MRAEPQVTPQYAEQLFRKDELDARRRGLFDAADSLRQFGDMAASSGVHWVPARSYDRGER